MDEKTPIVHVYDRSAGDPSLWSRLRSVSIQLSFLLNLWALYLIFRRDIPNVRFSASPNHTREAGLTGQGSFEWAQIEPSERLQFHKCFDTYQCARLDVPLNWNASHEAHGPRAAIAIVKLAAKVPITDKRYGGAIILNPGGPGESGAREILTGGKHLQGVVDAYSGDSEGKFFDVISFDPRGVNNTTPRMRCFADSLAGHDYTTGILDYGLLWSSPSVLGIEWGHAQSLTESCSRIDAETGERVARYVNTAQTVEDMVAITERLGEWREAEAKRLVALDFVSMNRGKEILERLQWKRGREQINFWGFSYGTILGQTFAAMHPDRVGRLIIDGVLDPQDYYEGRWEKNLLDSDKIIAAFSQYCFDAGPERCPMHNATSAAAIEARFEEILMSLKDDPIPLVDGNDEGPGLLTYGDMQLHLLTSMYFSYVHAEQFWSRVAEIGLGNISTIKDSIWSISSKGFAVSDECTRDGPFSDSCLSDKYVSALGPFQTIMCADSAVNGGSSMTKGQFMEYVKGLEQQSKWIGPSWGRTRIACAGFKLTPAWTFDGIIAANTANPILAIGNTHDTVTPLQNAIGATYRFPGSVVVQHGSQGHTSYSNPSICTGRIVREYFQSGRLPANGTICTPRYRPFIGCLDKDEHGDCLVSDEIDEDLWFHLDGLARTW